MKKLLILVCVCLLAACDKLQENKQEENTPTVPVAVEETQAAQPATETTEEKLGEVSDETAKAMPAETQAEQPQEEENQQDALNKQLLEACQEGDLEKVKALIEKGADVNAKRDDVNYDENTPLRLASENGYFEIVELLVNSGADVNGAVRKGGPSASTPLIEACYKMIQYPGDGDNRDLAKYKQIINLLLDKGADVNVDIGEYRCTAIESPLLSVVKANDVELASLLIKKGANVNMTHCRCWDDCGPGEETPLSEALVNNNYEMVKLLLDSGATIDGRIEGEDYHVITYWDMAVRTGNKKIVELFVSKGTDVNQKIYKGRYEERTALELTDDDEIAQMLLKYGAHDTPLAALGRKDVETFNALLKTASQEEKNAALAKTVQANEFSFVQALVKAGADVNMQINLDPYPDPGCVYGTPLSVALDNEYTEVAAFLKGKGAKDAICFAVQSRDLQRIKQAIREGANLNEVFEYCDDLDCGFSRPIYRIIILGNVEILEEFIKAGAEIDINDAFRYAVDQNEVEIVKFLKDKGPDVNIKDVIGWTALMSASHNGHTEIVKLLLEDGADINAKNHNGQTALDIAKKNGHGEIIELLKQAGAEE